MTGHVISPEFNAGEHTDVVATIGMAAPATKTMAEPIYKELGLVCIQRWKGEGVRWPELGTASTSMAAGARLCSGEVLQLASGRTRVWGNIYGTLGARPSALLDQQG